MDLVSFNDLKVGDRFYFKMSYDYNIRNEIELELREKVSYKKYCDVSTDGKADTSWIKIFKEPHRLKIYKSEGT